MKKYLFLAILIGCSFFELKGQGGMDADSIEYFLLNHDLVHYFSRIVNLANQNFNKSDTKKLLELGHLLQRDFGVLDNNEKKELRRSCMLLGSKVWKLTGNINESLKLYNVAYENVIDKIRLDSLSWYIENEIANFYTMKGDYEKAAYFANLVEASLTYYHMNEFLSRYFTNKGTKLSSESNWMEAELAFKKGLDLADSIKYQKGIFANSLNLAELYNDHPDMGASEIYLKKSNDILPYLLSDKRYLEKKAELEIETAKYLSNHKEYETGIPLFMDAIQTLSQYYGNKNRREFAKYYFYLARAYLNADSIERSDYISDIGLRCLIPGYTILDSISKQNHLYAENSFIDLLFLKSQIYESKFKTEGDTRNLENALSSINLALYVNDLITDGILADPSKLISIHNNKQLVQSGISILFQLYNLGETNLFVTARSLFNRSKSLLYDEKTQRNEMISLFSSEDKKKWSEYQSKLLELHEQEFDSLDLNAVNGEILYYINQIDQIFEAYKNIDLPNKVPDNYIEYLETDADIYLIAQINNDNYFIKLGTTQDFNNLENRLNDFILLKGLSQDQSILNEMYNYLLGPIKQAIPDNIVIIPDGSIGYIPFEMLKNEEGKYLIENSIISYSYEYISYVKDLDEGIKTHEIFCLAPEYPARESYQGEKSRGGLYNLPFAQAEVDSICQLYNNMAFMSQSSDKADWEHNISDVRIFHYAGHAIIKGDKAFLALTANNDEHQQLTNKEINLMHNPLDLVVLSACETGLGKLELGEGIRSLGRSFMESGTKATIISLWNVNDRSTAKIMVGFYKYLKSGMKKDEALRQSKLDYLRSSTNRMAHPYYWAAFIPAGDMSPIGND